MKVLIVSDPDETADHYLKLRQTVMRELAASGVTPEEVAIDPAASQYCQGCLQCWVKTPGVCVHQDPVSAWLPDYLSSDRVIFLTPVVFGQASPNIKKIMERLLPTELPFFRASGRTTFAPDRYPHMPDQMVLADGDGMDAAEVKLFHDIFSHRPETGHLVCNAERGDWLDGFHRFLQVQGGDRA